MPHQNKVIPPHFTYRAHPLGHYIYREGPNTFFRILISAPSCHSSSSSSSSVWVNKKNALLQFFLQEWAWPSRNPLQRAPGLRLILDPDFSVSPTLIRLCFHCEVAAAGIGLCEVCYWMKAAGADWGCDTGVKHLLAVPSVCFRGKLLATFSSISSGSFCRKTPATEGWEPVTWVLIHRSLNISGWGMMKNQVFSSQTVFDWLPK